MAVIEISAELKRRLVALAKETGQTEEDLLRQALEIGIEDVEDYHRALMVSRKIATGEEDVLSLDELERRLGLAD